MLAFPCNQFGAQEPGTDAEILKFAKDKYGAEADSFPLGAIGVYSFSDKLHVGLQQIMAGARRFRIDTICRDDVAALTEEAAKISGLPYIMDAYREQAMEIMGN